MMSKLVRTYVEWRIKSSLESGDLKAMQTWLTVAVGRPFEEQHLNYVFADKQVLLDYARLKSNELLAEYKKPSFFERILPARYFTVTSSEHVEIYYKHFSFLRNFFNRRKSATFLLPSQSLLSTVIQAMTFPLKTIALSSWQRFLSLYMPKAAAITPKQNILYEFLEELKPSMEEESKTDISSFPEKYRPTQILKRPELLKRRMGLPAAEKKIDFSAFPAEETKEVVAESLSEWANDIQVIQEHVLDQVVVQEQKREQKQDNDQLLDQNLFMETVILQESDFDKADTHGGITAGILQALKRKHRTEHIKLLSDASNRNRLNRNDALGFSFSKAKDKGYLTLENLPLGFSVLPVHKEDKEDTLYFRLQYSEALYNKQKTDPKHVLVFDSLRANRNPPFTDMLALEKYSIEALISKKQVVLTKEQTAFVKQHFDTYLRRPYFVDLLLKLTPNSEKSVSKLIDNLMALEKKILVKLAPELGILSTNLLHLFLKFYSDSLIGLLSPSVDVALKILPSLKETELQLFFLLSHINFVSTTLSFEENWNAFHYFINYFKEHKLELTEAFVKQLAILHDGKSKGMFFALGLTIECLSLSVLPKFQASLLEKLPEALGQATEYLRAGFSFVHESMLLEEGDFPSMENMVNLSYEDLKDLFSREFPHRSTADCLSAVYLRYIASQLPLEHTEAAYKKWNKDLNKDRWITLQAYLKTLPSRFEKVQSEEKLPENEYKAHELYQKQDIAELLPNLGLEPEVLARLENQLNQINAHTLNYQTASLKTLKEKLADILQGKYQDKLTESLSLIRELHYRHTFNLCTQNPKVGEWLRLEQIVAILLAVYGEKSQKLQIETSEGKSLITSCIALLSALNGEKVDINTHTESMSQHAFAHIKMLAGFLGLKVADRNSAAEDVLSAHIYCTDLANGIAEKTMARFHFDKDTPLAGKRECGLLLVDEADNAKDMEAKMSTHITLPIENSLQNAMTEKWVNELNHIIRLQLASDATWKGLNSKVAKRDHILSKLSQSIPEDFDLDYWIEAIAATLKLEKSVDYVIENRRLCIVPWEINGRKDMRSQWGRGMHYCQTLWEKSQGADVILPGFSTLVASGDVASYAHAYKKRIALSGSLGSEAVQQKIGQILGIDQKTIHMPRAKRLAPAPAKWPRKGNKTVYNRSYHFNQILEKKASQREKILEILQASTDASTLIHFNTIKECERFAQFLMDNGLSNIQIFDDKQDEKEANQKFRPLEATVIAKAKEPGMITLTTAAGGRAIDFKSVNQCLVTSPGLSRIVKQAKDRVGRNGEFAVVYGVYCIEDFDKIAQQQWATALQAGEDWLQGPQEMLDRPTVVSQTTLLEGMQERLEQADLDRIEAQRPLRELKHHMQVTMSDYISNREKSEQKKLVASWSTFFNKVSKERDVGLVQKQWEAYRNCSRCR